MTSATSVACTRTPSREHRRAESVTGTAEGTLQNGTAAANITLRATGHASEGISCNVETGRALVKAGLHPATGGDGTLACSGDMLLEALVACAGVTLNAVATAIGVELRDATDHR